MRMISFGLPSTLGSYRRLAAVLLGEESKAVKFLDHKIASSPRGAEEEVLADESQMLHMLSSLDAHKHG